MGPESYTRAWLAWLLPGSLQATGPPCSAVRRPETTKARSSELRHAREGAGEQTSFLMRPAVTGGCSHVAREKTQCRCLSTESLMIHVVFQHPCHYKLLIMICNTRKTILGKAGGAGRSFEEVANNGPSEVKDTPWGTGIPWPSKGWAS